MRNEVLGLVAILASGSPALAQYAPYAGGANPGEPLPIYAPMYPSAGPGAYASSFPSYAPPPAQEMQPPAMPPYAPPYAPAYSPLPYAPAPYGPGYGSMPAQPAVPPGWAPGMLTSQSPPPAPPMPPGFQPPAPGLLPPGVPAPAPKLVPYSPGGPTKFPPKKLADRNPDEPYVVAEPTTTAHGHEPYFQQVDPWRPVRGARAYAVVDYLLWWTDRQTVPAVTTVGGIDLASQAGPLSNDPRSGVRATIGGWITPMKNVAVEATYFFLGEQLLHATTVLPGAAPTPATLPFFFGLAGQSGQLTLDSQLWGAETNARYQLCYFKSDCTQWFVDFLGGFRYLDLSEGIAAQSTSAFAPAPVLLSGVNATAVDNFFTHNNFYGGQLGAEVNFYYWRVNVDVFGKVALGDNVQTANITGFTNVVSPAVTTTLPGGILAQPSNIGHHTRDVFAVVPEAGVNLSFRVCQYCQLGVGYSFLYFSNVIRPGNQIAPVPTTSPVPALTGAPSPAFNFQESHFWANGLNARIMFIF